jgi:lipopolysaccharide transport system ATP-binding protein
MNTLSRLHEKRDGYAISIENLGKRYTIGRQRSSTDGIRHVIESAVRAPFARLRSGWQKKIEKVDFWALRNVSINIKHGEVVGIIGRNGAGKSTMLKILSRITIPSEGKISIDGRIASLLEVGTGFHPELTGRENVFLNGAILGMTRAEILSKFDEIVAFSEIEEFLDTPVKRYSSGMYVRLAFSVAAHLDPEILICDEVLAVGDVSFQKKCLAKIKSFAECGKTVLFVSHSMDTMRNLCERIVWINGGHVQKDGPSEEVIEAYVDDLSKQLKTSRSNSKCSLSIENVLLRNRGGQESNQFNPGDDLVVEVSYNAQSRIESPMLALGVVGINGPCFISSMLLDGHRPKFLEGKGKILCTFKSIPLLPQSYTVKLSVRAANGTDMIIPYQEVAYFNVVGDLAEYGYKGDFETYASRSTSVIIPYEWKLPDGSTVPVALSRTADNLDFSLKG